MEVTFTKASGRRYLMTVVRERGVELAPRQGPGYHDYLPHDAVHFIVESEAGLAGAVFGRLARGESNIFAALDGSVQRRVGRREGRRARHPADGEEMARSELLASAALPIWELRAGQRRELPVWLPGDPARAFDSRLLERIMTRLDEFAGQWRALPVEGSMTLSWPLPVARRFETSSRRRGPRTPSGHRQSGRLRRPGGRQ
jgi:hypothetical protein